MKMKNKLNILVLSVILVVIASCNVDNYLDEKPYDALDQTTALLTLVWLQLLLLVPMI